MKVKILIFIEDLLESNGLINIENKINCHYRIVDIKIIYNSNKSILLILENNTSNEIFNFYIEDCYNYEMYSDIIHILNENKLKIFPNRYSKQGIINVANYMKSLK